MPSMSSCSVRVRASSAWDHVAKARGDAALFNGDCLELLQKIPDNSVSLVATSPPYCMGKAYELADPASEAQRFAEEVLAFLIPVLIVYFFAQNRLIGGISSVGIKG